MSNRIKECVDITMDTVAADGRTKIDPTPTPTPPVPSTYSVIYDGNLNDGGDVPVDEFAYSDGDAVTVLGNTGTLVKTGYAFSCWNTQRNGSGTDYAPDATFTIGTSNVTLYAKWVAADPLLAYWKCAGNLNNEVTGGLPLISNCTFTADGLALNTDYSGAIIYGLLDQVSPSGKFTLEFIVKKSNGQVTVSGFLSNFQLYIKSSPFSGSYYLLYTGTGGTGGYQLYTAASPTTDSQKVKITYNNGRWNLYLDDALQTPDQYRDFLFTFGDVDFESYLATTATIKEIKFYNDVV